MDSEYASVRRRKLIILIMGVALSFFTSMNKILVPGPVICSRG